MAPLNSLSDIFLLNFLKIQSNAPEVAFYVRPQRQQHFLYFKSQKAIPKIKGIFSPPILPLVFSSSADFHKTHFLQFIRQHQWLKEGHTLFSVQFLANQSVRLSLLQFGILLTLSPCFPPYLLLSL
jgi:hypothetical protein